MQASHALKPSLPPGARRARAAALMLMSGLALAWGNAAAAWTYVGDISEGVIYYDEATLKKAGATATLATMVNFNVEDPPKAPPKAGTKPPASTVMLMELDCGEARLREMATEGFSQQNGKGTSLSKSAVPGAWKKISAPTFAKPEALIKVWNFACGKS